MIPVMIWQMTGMVMEVLCDYYWWVWMIPVGPGVMYEMVTGLLGMIMMSLEMLLTCYMMIGI